jgi:radical SAM protein with 4Fe4S-binding SPASM domain
MTSLLDKVVAKAQRLGVPLSAHLDVTWRCNARCVHCYVDQAGGAEMSTAEMKDLLGQLAEAGTLFLLISGGEPLLREDLFELIEAARGLTFNVKLKTNGTLIGAAQARRLRALGVEEVHVSLYSHRPEVQDAIMAMPGAWARSLAGVRLLRAEGVKVRITDILMRPNAGDHAGVRALARELGAGFSIDPTITPKLNGDRSVVALNITRETLREVVHNPDLVGDVEEFCATPSRVDARVLAEAPCSAGHTLCFVSPGGDVYPCVQFPWLCGNVRRQSFLEVWRDSPQLREVRSIRGADLGVCAACALAGVCTRCPGLAYMEGDLRGPSAADCEKSFARTGVRDPGMRLE